MRIILLSAIIFAIGLIFPTIARGQRMNTQYNDIYKKYGNRFNIDWRLIKAIAMVESSEDKDAFNSADPSVGLMQVLCQGWPDKVKNDFPAVENWPPASPQLLFDADYNVSVGAAILNWNVKTYGMPKGIAVYNAWDQRNEPQNGPFKNQKYVDKVLRFFEENKKDYPNG